MAFFEIIKKYYLNFIFLLVSCFYIFFINDYRNELFSQAGSKIDLWVFQIFTDLIIIATGQFACKLIKELLNKNTAVIRFLFSFIILLFVNLVLILKTNFAAFNMFMWDYSSVYDNALKYDYSSYHHIFTVIYYIIALNVFPFKFGVVLFQAILQASIFAFIWAKLCSIHKLKFMWILILPLFLYPVLRMEIQPIRSSIYYVFAVLLFALFYIKEKENKPLNYLEILIFSILSAIVCSWRTENVILFLLIPLILFTLGRNKINFIKGFIFLLIFYSVSIFSYLSVAKECYVYSLLPFSRPLSAILKTDFNTNNKEKDIEIISKCYNADKLKQAEQNEALKVPLEDCNETDVNNFVKTSIKLIVLNPITYLKERIQISKNFTDFYLLTDNIEQYDEAAQKIIKKLEFHKFSGRINYSFILNYSPIIPIFFMLITLILALYKRQKTLFLILFTSIIMSIFSYMFCAEPFFHYFLQSYVLGWYIFTYWIVLMLNKIRDCIIKLRT